MNLHRFLCLFCAVSFLIFPNAIQAKGYPERPIELVIPMAPGGSADVAVRIFSEELGRALKVPIIVVNRAGGSGIQGSLYVAKARKDGYTLLQGSGTSLIIMPIINKEATYDPLKDFIPIAQFASVPSAFVVRSESPFRTLNDLIEYARANPGKLKNGAGGLGTESYFNLELLCVKNKIKITTIPFKSGGEALPALLGGHVDMASNTITTVGPQIKAGKLRGLAVTSDKRLPDFPDVPTTAEEGMPDINFRTWFGLLAPAGTPPAVIKVLIPVAAKIFTNPEIIQRAVKAGFMPDYKAQDEFRKFIKSRQEIAERVAREAGLSKK
jgi:tripartite-type tricarboxylate transporter receptor subunit TctC